MLNTKPNLKNFNAINLLSKHFCNQYNLESNYKVMNQALLPTLRFYQQGKQRYNKSMASTLKGESVWDCIWCHGKDVVETNLHKRMCKGELTLYEVKKILATDWVGYYCTLKGITPKAENFKTEPK